MHPNLYMSLRPGPVGRAPQNHPLRPAGALKPEWRQLLQDFADRFVIGTDQFIAAPGAHGRGPGLMFAQHAPRIRERAMMLLEALPQDLSREIGYENAMRLYRLH